jgi:outer membrane biosynthesis protein TonB
VDLAKLIERRDQLIADATAMLEGSGAGATLLPVELQQAQVERVEQRIGSLELRRAELVRSIDAELEELNSELAARRDRIEAHSQEMAALASEAAPAAAAAPQRGKSAKAAPKTKPAAPARKNKKKARSAKPAKPPKPPKAAKPAKPR